MIWRLENTPIFKLRLRKASSVTQFKCKGMRTRGAVVKLPVQGEDKMRCLAQADRKKGQIPPSSAFCSDQTATDWMMPPHIGRTVFLTGSTNSNANLM